MFKLKELVTVQSVAFSPDGKLLAFGDDSGTLRIWDVAGKRELFSASDHSATLNALAFSPDGTMLASVGKDGRLILRAGSGRGNAASWEQVRAVTQKGPAALTTVAFSPDGRQVVIGNADGDAMAYDVASLKIIWLTKRQKRGVAAVAYSPDGKLVATCGNDGLVELIDARSGKLVRELRDTARIASVAFSPDGKTLAAAESVEEAQGDRGPGGANRETTVVVKLRDPSTGQETAILKTTLESARMVAFSPDGKRLAVIGRERPGVANKWSGIIYVWEREP
jgi:WD40 repeat protein